MDDKGKVDTNNLFKKDNAQAIQEVTAAGHNLMVEHIENDIEMNPGVIMDAPGEKKRNFPGKKDGGSFRNDVTAIGKMSLTEYQVLMGKRSFDHS